MAVFSFPVPKKQKGTRAPALYITRIELAKLLARKVRSFLVGILCLARITIANHNTFP